MVIGILAAVGWYGLWAAFPEILGDVLILVLGMFLVIILTLYLFLNPYLNYKAKGDLIDREMHLFITRMGVLSASEASRKEMFEVLAQMREYGMLAQEIDRIFTLVSRWNVGLEKACRTVALTTPSELFSNFLLRLAHAVETGETAEEFFEKEQTVVMDQYAIRYEGAMRSIEIIKEVFIIMVVLLIMILVLIAFIPFLTKEDMAPYMIIVGGGFIALDLIIMYVLGEIVPGERIWHNMKMKTKTRKKIATYFQISIVVCGIVTGLMIAAWPLINAGLEQSVRTVMEIPAGAEVPQQTYYIIPLIILSFGLAPLLYPSLNVMGHEADIKKRDAQYPAFIRSLGGAVGARSKSITLPLKKLRQHDFGPLRKNVDDLYKRLSIRIKNERAWEYFAAETESELISKFNEMYVEGARTGDTKKISQIISNNFIRITGLRNLKYESGSTFLWMLYGMTASMTFLMFFGLYVVEQFANLFQEVTMPEESAMEPLYFFQEALVHIPVLWTVMWVVLVVHCLISALMVKSITGGHRIGAGAHFVGMIWTGAITAVIVMYAAQFLVL